MRTNIKKTVGLLIFLILTQLILAHPWKPSHYVIIDTDGGLDDMKALNMLMASPDVRVLAIIASGGVMPAEEAYIKVRSLMDHYFHEGMIVGINSASPFREMALPIAYQWADDTGTGADDAMDHLEVLRYVLKHEKTPVSFISLGSLNTVLSFAENYPELFQQVKEIIWSNDGTEPLEGFNCELDSLSARMMMQKETPVKIVGYHQEEFYSTSLIEKIGLINTPYAKKTHELFISSADHDFVRGLVDDMIPLYLHYPEVFTVDSTGGLTFVKPLSKKITGELICTILSGNTVNRNQVFKEIPTDTSYYFPDLQGYIPDIIERHGKEEFEAGVLTNELHRHFGIYATIGVKMGMRAREYFHIGVDKMNVLSYAGNITPVSCMNDGLQVSTGATAGHGLLKVVNDEGIPEASFTYMDRTIKLKLKDDISSEIRKELKEINFVYGLDSNIYWELVRQKAILYWKNLDRHEIFEIVVQ
ncbi:MAG: nucleoside hydrolase [Bacteroidales bacterium]|jgi:pyrimidine-specific ribonucleoside hydrolase|nr:nucleoside hydrolase [Bacteroidales bacterium]